MVAARPTGHIGPRYVRGLVPGRRIAAVGPAGHAEITEAASAAARQPANGHPAGRPGVRRAGRACGASDGTTTKGMSQIYRTVGLGWGTRRAAGGGLVAGSSGGLRSPATGGGSSSSRARRFQHRRPTLGNHHLPNAGRGGVGLARSTLCGRGGGLRRAPGWSRGLRLYTFPASCHLHTYPPPQPCEYARSIDAASTRPGR